MLGETWACHICSEERPDALISVLAIDTTKEFRLPHGTMIQNVRYCNDRRSCIEAAPAYRHVKNPPGGKNVDSNGR